MEPLDAVVAFVEGRTSAQEFGRRLLQDESLRGALTEEVAVPPYTNAGTVLDYVLGQDLSRVVARVNVRDLLSRLLSAKGVPHRPDGSALEIYGLMLDAQPRWLDLSPEYLEPLLEATAGIGRRERKAALKNALLARFRCLKSPPRWLQSPEWPFAEGRPMVFVGQLDMGPLAHDDAQVYVFADEATGEIRTIVQSA